MIHGYYAIYFESARTLGDIPWQLLTVTCLLIALAIFVFRMPTPQQKKNEWIAKLPELVKQIAAALALSALSMTTVFYILLVAL